MLKINDLVGKDVIFHIGLDPVLANIEDINDSGFTCKVKTSRNKWYEVNERYYIPIHMFVLHVQK